jgi:hypothetical protein
MKHKNGGGIMLPKSNPDLSKQIFTYYLNNLEKIQVISVGGYGIVLLLSLPENIDISNENNFYKQIIPNENYGKIVKKLLIKLQFVNDQKKISINIDTDYKITSVKKLDIENEINIQTDIFFKTLNYMQPLCPSIIYADILTDDEEKLDMMNLLKKADFLPNNAPVENIISINNIGIIAMEMVNDSRTLYTYISESEDQSEKVYGYINNMKEYINDNMNNIDATMRNIDKQREKLNNMENKEDIAIIEEKIKNMENYIKSIEENIKDAEKYIKDAEAKLKTITEDVEFVKNICRYALLKLALETGYNHSDFHNGNILLEKDTTYFDNIKLSPVLIDFGRTNKLDLNILYAIKKSVEEKNYVNALSYLCQPYNTTKTFHTKSEYKKYYGWICGDYGGTIPEDKLSDSVNIQIDELFKSHEVSIDKNVEIMNKLHDADPTKYPLLPLSNNIKNLLYNGMIGGRKKRKTRKNKSNKIRKKDKRYKTNKTNRK